MVYNAMKLFMEVNPQLFDECSHDYTEQQNNAEAAKQSRQAKWDRLTQLAEQMKQNGPAPAVRPPPSASYGGGGGNKNGVTAKPLSPLRQDDRDPLSSTQENQRRMEQLRLQDDRDSSSSGGSGSRSRSNKEYSNSVR